MAWADLPAWMRRALADQCTTVELEAVKLAASGLNLREISDHQHVTPEAVRKRLDRAYQKARRHPDWRTLA